MGKRVTNATAAAVAAIETAAAGLQTAMPAAFPRLLYGRSVAEDLEALPAQLLARAAAAAYEHLAAPRRPETINLRFRDDEVETVHAENLRAHRLGINGVPCFVVGGRHAIAGAQDQEVLARLLDVAAVEATLAARPPG